MIDRSATPPSSSCTTCSAHTLPYHFLTSLKTVQRCQSKYLIFVTFRCKRRKKLQRAKPGKCSKNRNIEKAIVTGCYSVWSVKLRMHSLEFLWGLKWNNRFWPQNLPSIYLRLRWSRLQLQDWDVSPPFKTRVNFSWSERRFSTSARDTTRTTPSAQRNTCFIIRKYDVWGAVQVVYFVHTEIQPR